MLLKLGKLAHGMTVKNSDGKLNIRTFAFKVLMF